MSERFSKRMRERRADAIVDAATRSLTEDGCFRFTVEGVAAGAGVAKGTVYLHFANKSALIAASLRRSCDQILSALADHVGRVADAGDRLDEAVRVLASLTQKRPELRILLERRLPCAAAWAGADVTPYVSIERYLGELLADAQGAGALDSGLDTEFAAQAILAMISVPTWRRLAADGPEGAVNQIRALLGGLRPSPKRKPAPPRA